MLHSRERRSLKAHNPSFSCSYHTFPDSFSNWEAFPPWKHIPKLRGRGRGVVSGEVINPLLGKNGQLGNLLAPFTKQVRGAKSKSPGRGQSGLKKPPSSRQHLKQCRKRGAARIPGKGGLRQQEPEGSGRPGPRSETGTRPGGSRDPQLRPDRPGSSPRTWSAGARSMVPAAATGPR